MTLPTFLDLKAVLELIEPGDLLLFRAGRSCIGRAIAVAGRTRYSHAAMFARWHDVPMVLEVRELRGGRAVTLASQVRAYPARIDVFQVHPAFSAYYDRGRAVEKMRSKAGNHYGYGAILASACLHLPGVRLFARPCLDDTQAPTRPEYCSAAVAAAVRFAGIDPVPQLADGLVEPGDLARSRLFCYSGTIRSS